MRAKSLLCLITFIVSAFYSFHASAHELQGGSVLSESPRFIENRGQVKYQNGQPAADVKYIYAAPGFKLILKENSFSYEVYTTEKTEGKSRQNDWLKTIREKVSAGKFPAPSAS